MSDNGCTRPATDVSAEAATIACELSSGNVTVAQADRDRLLKDVQSLPGKELLALQKELDAPMHEKGLANPLLRRPETDRTMGYPRFTGNEFIVMIDPFEGIVDAVRATQEHSRPPDNDKTL